MRTLGDVPTRSVSQCCLAGRCLHGREHVPLRQSVGNLRRGLKKWFEKGTTARRFYDRGACCFRLFSGDGDALQQFFFHIGDGNLNPGLFTASRLDIVRDGARVLDSLVYGTVPCRLQLVGAHPAGNFWDIVEESIDFSKSWDCDAWRVFSSDALVSGEFEPAVVDLCFLSPLGCFRVWTAQQHRAIRDGRGGDGNGGSGDNLPLFDRCPWRPAGPGDEDDGGGPNGELASGPSEQESEEEAVDDDLVSGNGFLGSGSPRRSGVVHFSVFNR